MPHKHTRRGKDPSTYDLPPTTPARALPTYKSKPSSHNVTSNSASKASKPSGTRRAQSSKNVYALNDTPRAFTRLLQPPPPPRAGLDNGDSRARKKRKINPPETSSNPVNTTSASTVPSTTESKDTAPQIQPGESLSAFSARVNTALPISGLARKGKGAKITGERQTRTERKIQRMVREWRVEDEKRRQRKQEEIEEQEDDGNGYVDGFAEAVNGKKKGMKRKAGDGAGEEGDIWAHIAPKPLLGGADGGAKAGVGLVGLHDVVQAPPKFKKLPREKFPMRGQEGINKRAIGLKRQAELGEARREVIDAYRALMKENGKAGERLG